MLSCRLLKTFRHRWIMRNLLQVSLLTLKKTLDIVDYDILLKKLDQNDVKGITKEWFNSYLIYRKQFVVIENEISSVETVSTDVLQGSVLGSVLSLIYINNLNTCIKSSKTHQLADDTSIMQANKSLGKLVRHINNDLSDLSYWLRANKLSKRYENLISNISLFKADHSV